MTDKPYVPDRATWVKFSERMMEYELALLKIRDVRMRGVDARAIALKVLRGK